MLMLTQADRAGLQDVIRGAALTSIARRARLVTIGAGLQVTIDTDLSDPFSCAIQEPAERDSAPAPRDRTPAELRWIDGPPLAAGSRITVDDVVWELVDRPVAHRLVHTAAVLSLAELYPRIGALQALGGGALAANVPLAVWQPSEADRDSGNFEGYRGEAPIEHREVLETDNAQIALGATTLKIVHATVDYERPKVNLELRRG